MTADRKRIGSDGTRQRQVRRRTRHTVGGEVLGVGEGRQVSENLDSLALAGSRPLAESSLDDGSHEGERRRVDEVSERRVEQRGEGGVGL